MKILLIHNFYRHPGGEDVAFRSEADLLRSKGHQVFEFTENNSKLSREHMLKAATNAVWSRESYHNIRNVISRVKPDIAHFHNTFLRISPAAYYACKEAGIPVVQTLHNYRLICPNALLMRNGKVCEECIRKMIPWPGVLYGCWRQSRVQTMVVSTMLAVHRQLRTWTEQVDAYVALTEFGRQKFVQGGIPVEKIAVKPNFVHPDPGERPFNDKGAFALFVGRLSVEKGIQTLLRAWKSAQHIPLKVVGDGPLRSLMNNDEQSTGVVFLGRRPRNEIMTLMKESRFLIFPSEWYETFGLSIIESFACGRPVIASRLGAMAEIVEDGHTGLLFEAGSAEDLAEKVIWAWNHPDKMAEMGQNARSVYLEKYTAEKNYSQLMDIYYRVIVSKN